MLTLDGSHGEGGGQILRTSLALATALGRPFRLTAIRARRPRPGLRPQHLLAVRALAAVSGAEVGGDLLGSTEISFAPGRVRPGTYRFDVGTAGAVALVLQALLVPLGHAETPSTVTLVGGTHVPWSPHFHYLAEVFFPALAAVGIETELKLERWGWHPRGGGEITVRILPHARWCGLTVEAAPCFAHVRGLSAVSRLPRSIAERQRRRAEERLAAAGLAATIAIEEDAPALGAGTLVFLWLRGRAGFSSLGRRGLPAERVADAAVDALLAWRASGAALDEHLADQLVPFLALAEGGSTFTCPALSSHLATVAWVVEQFVEREVVLEPGQPARVRVGRG